MNHKRQPAPGEKDASVDCHIEQIARALYRLRNDQLAATVRALERLARLARHYQELDQDGGTALSCGHLCETHGQEPLALRARPVSK